MFGHFSSPPPWFQQNNTFRKRWWSFGLFFFPFFLLRQLFEGLSAKALSRDRGGSRVSGIIASRHEIWFAKYLKKVGAGFVFSLSLVNGN